MFPISDSIRSKTFPFLTVLLIATNVYFFFQELSSPNIESFIRTYGLVPANINFLTYSTLTSFVTSMFLHGGFLHIISNMWFLWIFGDDIEDHLGRINYVILYFGSGIIGGLLQYFMNPTSTIPMIGASGAVSGVLGAYYVLFPHSSVRSIVTIFFFISIVNIPAGFYLFYWFIIQLFQGAASSVSYQSGGVAFFAHVGGFIAGVLFARMVKQRAEKNYIEGEIVE